MTKAQIDRLGNRLRVEASVESDLRLLDEYRRSFGPSFQEVLWLVREHSKGRLQPSGRYPKTPGSIVAKLIREPSIRLTQVQDIAGCRIVVPSFEDQMVAQMRLEALFADTSHRVIDRRERPSHGYRAVHLVVEVRSLPVEIQIRTNLQHLWAELCEKLADEFGADIKYGGGLPEIRDFLSTFSRAVAEFEQSEQDLLIRQAEADLKSSDEEPAFRSFVSDFRKLVERRRAELHADLRQKIDESVQRARLDKGTH